MHVSCGVPLAPLTTLGIGGPAASLAELHDLAEFPDFVQEVHHGTTPPVCLGEGSNVLVDDRGCSLPVLRIATRGIRVLGPADDGRVLVEVQAGHPLWDLVETLIAEGLAGMEMLAGIPGTTGATPVQNVERTGRRSPTPCAAWRCGTGHWAAGSPWTPPSAHWATAPACSRSPDAGPC
ncbi:FAD-binding protein [Streptomyces noursei]|nr:FAD-binding protein [Streptomyces noursei]